MNNNQQVVKEINPRSYNCLTGITDLNNPFLEQESQFPWASDRQNHYNSEANRFIEPDFSFNFDLEPVRSCNINDDSWSTLLPSNFQYEENSLKINNNENFACEKLGDLVFKNPDLCINPVKMTEKSSSHIEQNPNHTTKEIKNAFVKELSCFGEEVTTSLVVREEFPGVKKCEDLNQVDSYINYSSLVDNILDRTGQYGQDLSCRKDVLNKKILRAFRKFIANSFNSCKRPSRSSKPFEMVKEDLVSEAVQIGLLNPNNSEENTEEFKEFICWMAMAKVTTRTKKLFCYKNISIKNLSEVLTSYSHNKLKSKIFTNTSIGKCFKYFMEFGLGKFLKGMGGVQQCIYKKAANQLLYNFGTL